MTAPTPDVVAELAEALAAHSVEDYSDRELYGDKASLLCLCKFVAYGSDLYDAGEAHREHLAAALAPIVARREAAARAGELRAAAADLTWVKPDVSPCRAPEDCCGDEAHCDVMQPHVKVVDADWLRGRADRVEAEAGEGT